MKIGLQITARLKSSRLPLKLLLDLNGSSVLERVIQRSKEIRGVDEIVLCTSLNSQDLPLIEVAKENDIFYYLGSDDDVLQRLLDSAKYFGFDYILSITGENPLYSIYHANRLVDAMKIHHYDFSYFDGLPIGCSVYGIKTKALEVVCKIKTEIDTEIWGPLLNRPEIFNVKIMEVEEFYKRPFLRLTNDYFEDYKLMEMIFSNYAPQTIPSLSSVLEILDAKPELLKVNSDKKQMTVSEEMLRRIDQHFKTNKELILKIKNDIYARV